MSGLKAANLAVKFGLELAALAAFAYWGGTVGSGIVSVLLAVLLPVIAAALWARFAAPRSTTRLALRWRVPFELGVFALAALALTGVSTAVAIAFAVVVIVNAALLTAFDQWES